VAIGSYQSCHYIASGVTAEVYRAQARALKVITETRNIDPHDPLREAKILESLKKPCIPLLETFRDQQQRFVLVFPYMPLSLEILAARGPIPPTRFQKHFIDLFSALHFLHSQGIIHRDVKPSALLLESPDGPAYLSDFGIAWHPDMSTSTEPAEHKILDIGTGPYRAPEVLFGNNSYGTAIDMWAAGAMVAECCRHPPRPLFDSRPVNEDGNQLGLILSIFKTLGTPTRESWPEATEFRTPPFEMYQVFEQRRWEDILPEVQPDFRAIIAALVRYNNNRATAAEVCTPVQTPKTFAKNSTGNGPFEESRLDKPIIELTETWDVWIY
jgi:serine/threonine protein kinase